MVLVLATVMEKVTSVMLRCLLVLLLLLVVVVVLLVVVVVLVVGVGVGVGVGVCLGCSSWGAPVAGVVGRLEVLTSSVAGCDLVSWFEEVVAAVKGSSVVT